MSDENSVRVVKNTGFMFIRMLVVVAVGLFTSRKVLWILGVDDFGIYNLVGTLVLMFTFLQGSLYNATSRYIAFDLGAGNISKLRKTFSTCLYSEVILAIIVIVLSEIAGAWMFGHFLNIPENRVSAAKWVFHISLVNVAIGIIRTPFNSLIIAHEKMDFYALTSILEAVAKLFIVYMLLIISADKLITYAFLLLGVTVAIFAWMVYYCNKHFKEICFIKYWNKKLIKELLGYSGWSLVVDTVDTLAGQSVGIFFNKFYGVAANAAYGVAWQVNDKLNYFFQNFSTSYNPQIVKSYAAKKFDYFMKLIFSTSKMSFFLYFLVAFPIMVNIEYLLRIWLIEAPAMADTFTCLLIAIYIFDSFSAPLWQAVYATGNIRVHQILMASIKIMIIPVSYFFLKNGFPIYTVLVVYAVFTGISSVVRIVYLHWLIHLDLKAYFKKVIWQMLKITLISVPLPLILRNASDDQLVNFFNTCGSFFLIYLPAIYFLALTPAEKELVRGFLKKASEKIKR